jgi:two-component system, NarL family, response regulator
VGRFPAKTRQFLAAAASWAGTTAARGAAVFSGIFTVTSRQDELRAQRQAAGNVIRVLVVDDDFYTRLGTMVFLQAQPGMEVVGQAPDSVQALELFARLQPDITITDVRTPDMGVRLIVSLRALKPDARILVLTHRQGDEDISQALRAGARGYVTKSAPSEELLTAIRAVHRGQKFLPTDVLATVTNRLGLPELTPREREVLAQIADGASNRDAAAALGISERTVGIHVSNILGKLGAVSRTEAVSIATRRGILH